MKLNLLKKFITGTTLIAMTASFAVGCEDTKPVGTVTLDSTATVTATATPKPDTSKNDAPQNLAYVAKMGDVPIYETQFYYFLYTALSEAYYASEEFEKLGTDEYADKTDKEKEAEFIAFFNKKPEGSDKTNLQIAADRALEICHTFNISALRGKADKLVSDEEVKALLKDVDTVADKYADYYEKTRDDVMKAMYGMNVNDLKDYSLLQSYVTAYISKWKENNGYVFKDEEPKKPTKPTDPGDKASDEKKAEYAVAMTKYDEDLADYNDALKKYKEKEKNFWEQFREAYNKGEEAYRIVSVRYLFVSTLDEDGKKISEDSQKQKKAEIESYVKLSSEYGYDFAKVVKGFSESDTSICDIDIANSSDTPFNGDIVLWASKNPKITGEIKIFETPSGYYAVQVCGITDFDKTVGVVKDAEKVASPDKIKETVSYFYLNDLYNEYVLMLSEEEEYKLSDINYERMYDLAEEYMKDTGNELTDKSDK